MRDFSIKWIINIVSLFAVVHLIAGVSTDSWHTTVIAAFILGLLNTFLKPIIVVMTLPINVFLLGTFTLFINGLIFYIASKFVKGFSVSGFWSAFWAALVFSCISLVLNLAIKPGMHIRIRRYGGDRHSGTGFSDAIDVDSKRED